MPWFRFFPLAGVLALGANRGVQFYNLVPAWGTLLAVLLIGEAFRSHHFAGMALILAGVWLATARPAVRRGIFGRDAETFGDNTFIGLVDLGQLPLGLVIDPQVHARGDETLG